MGDSRVKIHELFEAYSAGGYSAELWKRWWGNDVTGGVIPVRLQDDHDAYLFDNLSLFFTPDELARLPDPEDDEPYDVEPEDEIQNSHDEILIAAYKKGWNAVIYDGNNHHLSLRTSSREPGFRGVRKIVRTIMQDTHVERMTLDIGNQAHQLDGDALERFLKFGRLPRA